MGSLIADEPILSKKLSISACIHRNILVLVFNFWRHLVKAAATTRVERKSTCLLIYNAFADPVECDKNYVLLSLKQR